MSFFFFFSSRRRHTRFDCDWSSDVCSSDLQQRQYRYCAAEHGRHGFFYLSLRSQPQLRESGAEFNGDDYTHAAECVRQDRKSTRLNSSHSQISYAVFCLKKKKTK